MITKNSIPLDKKINILLDIYKKGDFFKAEKLAISMTKEYPQHQFELFHINLQFH